METVLDDGISTLIEVMKWYLCGANIPTLKYCSSYP